MSVKLTELWFDYRGRPACPVCGKKVDEIHTIDDKGDKCLRTDPCGHDVHLDVFWDEVAEEYLVNPVLPHD